MPLIMDNTGDQVSISTKAAAEVFVDAFFNVGRSRERGVTAHDVDHDEFTAGILVEREHTEDIPTAAKIALDHLAEFPTYYTELAKMEERLRRKARQAKRGGS